MAALRRLGRRLAGRDGLAPVRRPPQQTSKAIGVQHAKTRQTEHVVREAQASIDTFTAAMEQAMRGQRS
jgi:hypothetical protein